MFEHAKHKYTTTEASEVFSPTNYYTLLGLKPNCTKKEIKDAYLKLAKIHHPDKNKGEDTGLFAQMSMAYRILRDEERRRDYDCYRKRMGCTAVDSFLSSLGKTKTTNRKRRRKRTQKNGNETGCTKSPPYGEERGGERVHKKEKKSHVKKDFVGLFNASTVDNRVYNGSPDMHATKYMVGIEKNVKGGIIKVPFKSVHHKGMLSKLDEDKVLIQEKETNLETEKGNSMTMRKEKRIFYEDEIEIKLAPLEKYPKEVVIPEGGSSVGIDQKKYKRRADLKITIDFSPTYIGNTEDKPMGMWQYYDNSCEALPSPAQEKKGKIYVCNDTDKEVLAPCGEAASGFIDCSEQLYYSSKIGELDVLTINLPVKKYHLTDAGFCASLELLDGREILMRYSKREFKRISQSQKKIFGYGPAVPHIVIKDAGYSYRVTDKTIKFVHIGRSPLVIIFIMSF